jgi:hypothetical protein
MGASSNSEKQIRNLLIRTNLALYQREVRTRTNWYNTPKVVVRTRRGKIAITRLGSPNSYAGDSGFEIIDY